MKIKRIKSFKRVFILDELRALCFFYFIINSVLYYLRNILNFNVNSKYIYIFYYFNYIAISCFVFLSGVVCKFSRNNFKRAFFNIALGFVMHLLSFLLFKYLDAGENILILNGVFIFIYSITKGLLEKIKFPVIGLILSFIIFYFLVNITNFKIGVLILNNSDKFLHNLFKLHLKFIIYFKLLAYFFVFLAGSFFGVYAKERRLPNFFYNLRLKFIANIGSYFTLLYFFVKIIIYYKPNFKFKLYTGICMHNIIRIFI